MSGYVDGVFYDDVSDAPDLGSLRCVQDRGQDGMIRSYRGLQADFSKLPTYVRTGSSCYMVDSGKLYMYEETGQDWILQE